jgi:predicted ATPase
LAADLERFRQKLREYRLLVNRSQGDLAAYLNLDYNELSNRLNAHKNAHLSHDNVRGLVRALAEWGAITTRSQAEELLDLMLCPHFDPVDLQARPLLKLVVSPTLPSTPTPGPLPTHAASYPALLAQTAIPAAPVSAGLPFSLINSQVALAAGPEVSSNLPQTLNPLLGRQRELAQALEMLGQPEIRLVTLTGAGGSGKTSLALAIGKQLLPAFSDRVFFVKLENVTRRESLVSEIAGTLKVRESGGQSLLENLKEFSSNKQLLLILDNFEQLAAQAGVLSELLKATQHLKLLVTSRIPLQLSFEHEFPVGSLALPDRAAVARLGPGELAAAYPGLALFAARAQAVKPGFILSLENVQPVVEICRRLDGLPLPLELAAARVRTFSPHKLLERLSLKVLTGGARDLPARQQTLRDTIAWSYDLLTGSEQRLFARLAVFVGGCTLEGAEAVCNPEGELELEVFDGVEALLTRNLLKQWESQDGETRYGMLVTIREFGLEKLAQSGEAGLLAQRYNAYYLARSRQLTPVMAGANRQAALRMRQIESEYANFRAVLQQDLAVGKAGEALELSVTLGDYFNTRGYPGEGLRFLEQGLALPYPADSPAARLMRSKALFWAGVIISLGDLAKASRYFGEALALQRELNDKPGIIYSLNRLSEFNASQGNYALSETLLAESLALSLELNQEEYLENTRSNLGTMAFFQGKYAEAQRWFEENLAMCSASGNRWGVGVAFLFHSLVASVQGK